MFKALDDIMSAKTLHVALLVAIFLNHALLSEGKRKYYPKELPIKTITIDDGDIYDCMKLDADPRVRDPAIRRKELLRAKFSPNRTITTNSSQKWTSDKLREKELTESESCPPGSVPVLKATKAGPLNLSAIDDFASARAKMFLQSNSTKPLQNNILHEYAVVWVRGTYGGGEGIFSVWEPEIEYNEMSLSQIWVVNQDTYNAVHMALEAGWMANPSVFGDSRTRFFIFTTADSYRTYLYNDNLRKPISGNSLQYIKSRNARYMPFGKRLQSSTFDGHRSEIKVTIKQDYYKDWQILVDGVDIGYWPKSNYMVSQPNKVLWGGEIVNRKNMGRHTSTKMGNGCFSTEPVGRVAYTRKLGIYDLHGDIYSTPELIYIKIDNPGCYDLTYWSSSIIEDEFGPFITFGGPGFDPVKCP